MDEGDDEWDIFQDAAAHLPQIMGKLDGHELLYLYARYKQATVGPCNSSKPGIFDFQSRKKWNAWNDLADMSKSQAKTEYIVKIRECDPDWDYKTGSKANVAGRSMSRPLHDATNDEDSGENVLFEICKNGELQKLKECVNNDYTICDIEGRSLLHWACDRGHYDVVRYLIENNCNVNAQDMDQLTPLHYASLCGYKNIVEILLENGGDVSIEDEGGDTPIDCAESSEIREMLKSSNVSG